MAGYDGAGSVFALGLRITKLNLDGTPMTGANNCYVTDALVKIGINQEYSDPDAIELKNGAGVTKVYYAPAKTLLNGTIDSLQFAIPDPVALQFCVGGDLITSGGTNEVQTVTITGTPTGGTFTLTFNGQTTAAIAYNAAASAVQSALIALNNLATGDVVVTGGPGPGTPYVITFGGSYANQNVANITATGALTGGTSPAVAVANTTPGAPGSTVLGYRAPEVNKNATPNGVAIEAWSNAIRNNAFDPSTPYIQWVLGRCKLNPSDAIELGGEDATSISLEGTIEQNTQFGTGPVGDITFPTDRLFQYCRVASIPDLTVGYVTVS